MCTCVRFLRGPDRGNHCRFMWDIERQFFRWIFIFFSTIFRGHCHKALEQCSSSANFPWRRKIRLCFRIWGFWGFISPWKLRTWCSRQSRLNYKKLYSAFCLAFLLRMESWFRLVRLGTPALKLSYHSEVASAEFVIEEDRVTVYFFEWHLKNIE